MCEHEPEIIECSECETTFDLARQNYYTNLCPSCHDEMEREMAEKEMMYEREMERAAERHFERTAFRR